VTRDFNLNLLHRINRELGADCDPEQFQHAPIYQPEEGRAMSFLVSKIDQQVQIPGAPEPVEFKAWESIHTETSHKYDMPLITALADEAGLRVVSSFTDNRDYFADVVLALK
jgi:L-histidine Nalpha-methyltransferase